jgi:putative transcriptional regulator
MSADSASTQLSHHFLIAMPGLEDEVFGRSVVYVCEHSARGAMGLIINKPAELGMRELFDKVDLPLHRQDLETQPVMLGGPVHTERGFVLHEPVRMADPAEDGGSIYASTLTVPDGLEMTTSRDVLEALASGAGPLRVLITLGYASWGEGQLESELAENTWLTVPAQPEVVFDTPIAQRYDKALSLLGLQAWMLSPEAGHA